MSIAVAGILYLLLFRLAVIGAGLAGIYFGYRLFLHRPSVTTGESVFQGKFANAEVLLRSTGPGIFFAGFGTFLVSMMLATTPPEFSTSDAGTSARGDGPGEASQDVDQTQGAKFGDLLSHAQAAERLGNREEAQRAYMDALAMLANAAAARARFALGDGRPGDARDLARFAHLLSPNPVTEDLLERTSASAARGDR